MTVIDLIWQDVDAYREQGYRNFVILVSSYIRNELLQESTRMMVTTGDTESIRGIPLAISDCVPRYRVLVAKNGEHDPAWPIELFGWVLSRYETKESTWKYYMIPPEWAKPEIKVRMFETSADAIDAALKQVRLLLQRSN